MNRFTLFAVAALLVAVFSQSDSGSRAEDTQPKADAKVQELMLQRRDTLRDLVLAVRQRMFAREFWNHDDYSMLKSANSELLKVELEIAETPDDVHRLLEDAVKKAEDFESFLKARMETSTFVLDARADRLRLEIKLLNGGND